MNNAATSVVAVPSTIVAGVTFLGNGLELAVGCGLSCNTKLNHTIAPGGPEGPCTYVVNTVAFRGIHISVC